MQLHQLLLLGSLAVCLLGCGANKGTQKGTDDLNKLETKVGSTGVPLPPGANEKNEKVLPGKGSTGGAAPGKGGPPPPPPG